MQWASVRHEDSAIGNARCIDGEGLSAPPRRAPRRAPERAPTHSSSWSESDSRFGWCDLVRTNQHVKQISQTNVTVFNCVRVLNKKKVCKAIFKCLILSTPKMPLRQSSNVCFSQQKKVCKAIFKCLLFSTKKMLKAIFKCLLFSTKKSLQGHLQMFAFLNKKLKDPLQGTAISRKFQHQILNSFATRSKNPKAKPNWEQLKFK